MQALLDGISWGLFLCILIGPIFFALVQAGIEQGFKAGIMLGSGIWVSDILFITLIYCGLSSVVAVTEWDGFTPTVGVVGGLILIAFGIGTLFSKAPEILKKEANEEHPIDYKNASFGSLWMKGFIVNTVNPFTLLFWIGLLSSVSVKNDFSESKAVLFFVGIMGTIILTDSLKVLLAQFIRQWMTAHHILWMRRISGVAFFIFGIVMIVRVML